MNCFFQIESRGCTVAELRASLAQFPDNAEAVPVMSKDGEIGLIVTDEGEKVADALLTEIEAGWAAIAR